jgi:hypothetical protein
MPITQTQIEAQYAVELAGVQQVQGADITAASPVNADTVSVTDNAATKVVSAPSVASQNAGAAPTVSYTGITTNDEITVTTLNKGVESLKVSTETALSALHTAVNQALVGVSTDASTALTSLVSDINSKFATLKGEQSTLAGDINVQFADLVSDINTAFTLIAEKESAQSNDIAGKINAVSADLNAQDGVLKTAIDEAFIRIRALDDVYGTDSDIAAKVASINALIGTLRESDLDFVDGLRATVTEINQLERHDSKEILVAATSGVFNVNYLAEAFAEPAVSADEVRVSVEVINNMKVNAEVINKGMTGFDIKLMSKGVHFVPQPHDASVTPVRVMITVFTDKKNQLTFNVDTLNGTYVTSGAGTDANAIPFVEAPVVPAE